MNLYDGEIFLAFYAMSLWGRISAALDGKKTGLLSRCFTRAVLVFQALLKSFVFFFSLLPSDVLKRFGLA